MVLSSKGLWRLSIIERIGEDYLKLVPLRYLLGATGFEPEYLRSEPEK